jgi:hypothetical protein
MPSDQQQHLLLRLSWLRPDHYQHLLLLCLACLQLPQDMLLLLLRP